MNAIDIQLLYWGCWGSLVLKAVDVWMVENGPKQNGVTVDSFIILVSQRESTTLEEAGLSLVACL